MPTTVVQRAFAAGELAPALGARADVARYQVGLRTCRNFIVQRAGGVANRTGTEFIAAAKTDERTFLFPFVFAAADASFAIEASDNYFRFYRNGARVTVSGVAAYSGVTAYVPGDLVVQGGINYYCKAATTGNAPPNATFWHPLTGNIYEIPTPYVSGRFLPPAPLCWSQSGLIVTSTHLNEPPLELVYEGTTRWILRAITTGPSIAAPANGAGTAGAVGTRTFRYVVTAGKAETYEESHPSAVIEIATAAEPTEDAPHELTWDPVAGAVEYYVYADPFGNGTFGLLGVATGAELFHDVGLEPDFSQTPPVPRVLFNATNAYPGNSVVYQQRRIMAGTHNDREIVYASQTGFRSNFAIRSPLQDDDAVTFSVASQRIQVVHHLVELSAGLVLLTDSGEWVVRGDESGVLRPTAINPKQHAYRGSSFTTPVVIGAAILFVQARGSSMRDLRFDRELEGLGGRDLSLYSSHLFKGYTISDLAYADAPDSVVWAVRSDGTLLGMTYVPEEDLVGWHRHDTDGAFEQVCVIPEGDEDAVYVVVKREIDGDEVRYIERLKSRVFDEAADAFFVDSGKTITNGSPSGSVTGLAHLAGKTVSALADGVVRTGLVVSGAGVVTLPVAATKVQVGLPITADIETLDLDVNGSSVRDKRKSVQSLALLLEASARGFFVGPDAAHLIAHRPEPWEVAAASVTGQVSTNLTSSFTESGRVLIRHTDPTPLTILGVLPHVKVGG